MTIYLNPEITPCKGHWLFPMWNDETGDGPVGPWLLTADTHGRIYVSDPEMGMTEALPAEVLTWKDAQVYVSLFPVMVVFGEKRELGQVPLKMWKRYLAGDMTIFEE